MVAQRKGAPGLADELFRRIIRQRGACENCGQQRYDLLQTAHIIGRKFSATRCDESNAFCLCASCHARFTDHPDEWLDYVDRTIGMDEYFRLKQRAEAGITVSSAVFWSVEVDRLKRRCVELELDTRRRIPA